MAKSITYTKYRQRLEEADNRTRPVPMTKQSIVLPSRDEFPKIDLLEELKKRVVGQDHVLEELVWLIYRFESGLAPQNAPLGTALLLGPTGTGKTLSCEALAEVLVDSPKALFKIDCAEFSHGHEIAKLIGAPPGYLGHRETHAFFSQAKMLAAQTEKFKANFILFDEIEKASDTLYNLLLGILDKGTLTLGDNSIINFNRSFIFMTSNLGARAMQEEMGPGWLPRTVGETLAPSHKKLEELAHAAAKKHFLPEFMNRIDLAAVYKPLGDEALAEILGHVLWDLQERLLGSGTAFVLRFPSETKAHLLKVGTSKVYGARELKRTVERLVTRPLTLKLRQEPEFFKKAREVEVLVNGEKTEFRRQIP